MDKERNLLDLLLFYTLERILFNRMVKPMGKNPKLVKMAMAFWLLLEEIGYHDLTRRIHSFDDSTIDTIFSETLSCLDCIRPGASEPDQGNDIPASVKILDEPINRKFFYYNSKFMLRRFTYVMDTVCNRIFGENAAIELDENIRIMKPDALSSSSAYYGTGRVPVGSGLGREEALNQGSDEMIIKKSCLNPNASEFCPRQQSNEDSRTMFLTFSKGHPLTSQEIINFFTL